MLPSLEHCISDCSFNTTLFLHFFFLSFSTVWRRNPCITAMYHYSTQTRFWRCCANKSKQCIKYNVLDEHLLNKHCFCIKLWATKHMEEKNISLSQPVPSLVYLLMDVVLQPMPQIVARLYKCHATLILQSSKHSVRESATPFIECRCNFGAKGGKGISSHFNNYTATRAHTFVHACVHARGRIRYVAAT